MDVVREKVEIDDRLLERSADFLRVEKREHDRVAVARRQGEIETFWFPSRRAEGQYRLPHLMRLRPQPGPQTPNLIRLNGKYVRPVVRPHKVEAPPAWGPEYVVGITAMKKPATSSGKNTWKCPTRARHAGYWGCLTNRDRRGWRLWNSMDRRLGRLRYPWVENIDNAA